MAFRRSYGLRSGRTRRYARTTRRVRRRQPARKRVYRRRPAMTRRRILNVTSRKKQDNMLSVYKPDPFTGTGATGGAIQFSATPSARWNALAFVATARGFTTSSGAGESNVNDDATRTATRCYARGIKEQLVYETTSGRHWLHRRICFTFYGTEILNPDDTRDLHGAYWLETSNGYVRAMTNVFSPTADTTLWGQIADVVFKGQPSQDWSDLITAKVDNRRVKLMYDHTYSIQSGNEEGVIKRRSLWHPMNKTIVYNDDEAGGSKINTELSANNRQSMGDYYILDIFDCGTQPASDDDTLSFAAHATYYWHER